MRISWEPDAHDETIALEARLAKAAAQVEERGGGQVAVPVWHRRSHHVSLALGPVLVQYVSLQHFLLSPWLDSIGEPRGSKKGDRKGGGAHVLAQRVHPFRILRYASLPRAGALFDVVLRPCLEA